MGDNWLDWFRSWSDSHSFAHPDSPSGGTGTGFSRLPGPLRDSFAFTSLPHPHSPAGRRFNWQVITGERRCREPIRSARTLREYISLLDAAERNLIRTGHSSLAERIHLLTGIYYGTTASLDFKVMH